MDTSITISELFQAKRQNRKIAAISCYDYTTAKLISQTGVQMILAGDSAAEIMLGFDTTLPATMDFMVTITAAVRRGAPNVFLVADMPFLSYQVGISEAIKNAGRFVSQARAQMVKIEATSPYLDVIKTRKKQTAFHPNASFEILDIDPKLFAVKRASEDQTIYALTNISSHDVPASLSGDDISSQMVDLLTFY